MSSGPGSGVVNEDTARAINDGRETIGVLLRTAQVRLQKVFIAFTLGMLGGIIVMRSFIWPQLKADLLAKGASVIAQTPFDVILLQVKIGLGLGVILAIPVLAYYAKRPLAERGFVPDVEITTWKLVAVGLFSTVLFVAGIAYAYLLFFPIMFAFLAGNAMGAGLSPMYSIVHWTQFIAVLALSFGLAAQMPLAMTALSYAEIVPYETFRDKWKIATVLIFSFGAVFSPPDPFTQIMWAMPLLALYGFSLYLSKVLVTARRGSEQLDLFAALRARWNALAGAAVLAFGLVYGFLQAGGVSLLNPMLSQYGLTLPPIEEALGLPRGTSVVVTAAIAALAITVLVTLYVLYSAVEGAAEHAAAARVEGPPSSPASPADPSGIDLGPLDAGGIYAAPPEAFASMSEEDALAHARAAMDEGETEKAQAILDRYDEVTAIEEETEGEEGTAAAGAEAASAAEEGEGGGEGGSTVSQTTAGMLNAFTEEETTEEDVGGYYYDIAFIFDSLRSRAFRLIAVFMLVLAGTFAFLYQGGIGLIRADFLSRIPAEVRPDPAATPWPITLHPVEALVFEVKIATIFAAIAILPFLLYYAWPALEERGILTGDRRTIVVWGGSIAVTLVAGSVLGYMYVAPEIISFLVYDAIQAGMIISYRVNNFFWMVFLTTAGIGLLAEIPVSMVLFHYGGLVPFQTMFARWRVVVLSAFAFGALVTPDSLYTMLLIGVPIAVAYLFGLAVLWVATFGGRRGGKPPAAAEQTT